MKTLKEKKQKLAEFRNELLLHAEKELRKKCISKKAFEDSTVESAKANFVLGMLYMNRLNNSNNL